jgi:queuine tRNA-ribosyltransferase
MTSSQAQTELLTTSGTLALPAFLPDATRGVVRSLGAGDLRRCGVQGVVVNAFHLASSPGARAVAAMGGIHSFMGWSGPVLSDSGGFQLYSLLQQSRSLGSITKKGFHYPTGRKEGKKLLSAEKSIRQQFWLGSDIIVCLDHCTHPDAAPAEQRASVEHTVRWAEACRGEFDRLTGRSDRRPLLFGVIQGGSDPALRRECADRLFEIGFDGYGYGGWPVTEGGRLVDAVQTVAESIPDDRPRWALGIGKPEHVAACVGMGYGLFDCTLPTRDARHGRLYVFRDDPVTRTKQDERFYAHVYPRDKKHTRTRGPVEESCDCLCCTGYSLGYLHHLFRTHDALAGRLATIHNLRFYSRLMERLRAGRS